MSSYQFIEVVEPANMSVVEEYLRHSIPPGSFPRFGPSLGITIQVDVDIF